ncbi:DUF4822 domain-containing protein [Rummeliibacillus pycnus]|uniref:DUF4822 domain-containing protein n=1 Tax=Rummeliibacillus pycnus TaxID=101070 RepID=UPI003D2CD4A6
MNNKVKMMSAAFVGSITLLTVGYGSVEAGQTGSKISLVQEYDAHAISKKVVMTKGQEMTKLLGSKNWKGTRVYDQKGNDLTKENINFIGLAKYDAKTGKYEFFDAKTGKTRGDQGTFFVTNDGKKRILISETMKYQAVVDMTKLSKDIFTYKRMGKDKDGKDIEVFVEHKPYEKNNLKFTKKAEKLKTSTGKIDKAKDGDAILSATLWTGTKVLDQKGNDVTKYNTNFISLAKFDKSKNKYEFFNINTGESRGDYGYFDVLNNNKVRAHVSIGENKYGAALELTELNMKKFTYKRIGKNAEGQDITIFVEHKPYKGVFKPNFSF